METFQDQYTFAQNVTGDSSAAQLVTFKADINKGGVRFLNALGRKFNKEYKKTNIVSAQQYYQTTADTLRISTVRVLNGTTYFTPELVASEDDWNDLNAITTSGSVPTHYYIRGFNEVGLYPIPSANVTNGMIISLEPQHTLLTAADFTTGTVTVTNGSITITHSASGFTPQMVGRYFQVTDSTDGKWYRIGAYTSSSVVTLENYYEGISGSGRTFRIGEVMKVPQGYQTAPVYYALEMYYLSQSDRTTADSYRIRFKEDLKDAKKTYGRSTSQVGVKRGLGRRKAKWIDLTPSVTYP
jgi:hypothetical protein